MKPTRFGSKFEINVSARTVQRLDALADQREVSRAHLVRDAVARYLADAEGSR